MEIENLQIFKREIKNLSYLSELLADEVKIKSLLLNSRISRICSINKSSKPNSKSESSPIIVLKGSL